MPKLLIINSEGTENSRQVQFYMRRIKHRCKTDAYYLGASSLISPEAKPKALTAYRLGVLFPMLEERWPSIPIIVCGLHAAKLMVGGNPSDTSMAGKVYEVGGRLVAFSYGFDYIEANGGLEHLIQMCSSALASPLEVAQTDTFSIPNNASIVTDVETTGTTLPWYGSEVKLIGIKPVGEPAFICKPEEMTDEMRRELAMKTRTIIGHNLMFDLQHLAHIGVTFPFAKYHDTMIYQKCLGRDEESYGLKSLSKYHYNFPHWEAWFHTQLKHRVPMGEMDWGKLVTYNAGDLWATETFFKDQQKPIATFQLEMDYMQYVFHLIRNGMKVDQEKLETLIGDSGKKILALDTALREEYGLGPDFNFNSPDQVLNLLGKYVSSPLKGTGVDILEKFQDEAPIIKSLLELRNLTKLKGTSLEGLKEFIDRDGLVHTSLSVHGAETGRSTSSAPNLQNTDPRARVLFVSRYPGGRLVHTDLSGIEYRLIGHTSRDRSLCKIFNNGEDIHSFAYRKMFGRDPIDKVERKVGKTANFGGVYGCAFNKFSTLTGLVGPEGREAYKVVSGMYPGVEEWKQRVIADLRRDGTIRNLFGRVRYFSSATMDDEREAINWIIQSSGHDILKIYSMELCDRLAKAELFRTLLISEVHDSNTFDSPADEYERARDIVLTLANNLNPLVEHYFGVKMRVPILAEVEIMEHWA